MEPSHASLGANRGDDAIRANANRFARICSHESAKWFLSCQPMRTKAGYPRLMGGRICTSGAATEAAAAAAAAGICAGACVDGSRLNRPTRDLARRPQKKPRPCFRQLNQPHQVLRNRQDGQIRGMDPDVRRSIKAVTNKFLPQAFPTGSIGNLPVLVRRTGSKSHAAACHTSNDDSSSRVSKACSAKS